MFFSIRIGYFLLILPFFGSYFIFGLSLTPNHNIICTNNLFRNSSGFISSLNNSVYRQNKLNSLFSKPDGFNSSEGNCQVRNYCTIKEFEDEFDRVDFQDLGLVGVSGFVNRTDDELCTKKIYIRDGTTMLPLKISIKDNKNIVPNKNSIGPGTRVIATGSSMCNQIKDGSLEYYVSIDTNIEGHKLEHSSFDNEDYMMSMEYDHNDFKRDHKKFPEHRLLSHKFRVLDNIRYLLKKFIEDYFYKKKFTMIHVPIITSSVNQKYGKYKVKIPLSNFPQINLEMAAPSGVKSFTFTFLFRPKCLEDKNRLKLFPIISTIFPDTTIKELIDSIEDLIRDSARYVLDDCTELLEQASKYNDKLKDHLSHLSNMRIRTMTYDDAINMLNEMRKSEPEKYKYQYIDWGGRLSDSHEKSLMDHYDNKEIIAITNYPESITPFYMKRSVKSSGDHSKTTVENFYIIAPFGYEIAGGSLREDDYKILKRYLKIRELNSINIGGLGISFDRLIMLLLMVDDMRYLAPLLNKF